MRRKHFAITLQFYSTKAYEFVQKTFLKFLPRVSMRKWFSNADGKPGFSEMALKLLRNKVEDESKRSICINDFVTSSKNLFLLVVQRCLWTCGCHA